DMKNLNAYEYLRLLAIYKYLNTIFNNEESYSCIKLSLEILQQVFQRGPWIARHIREWSKSWIATGTLPVSQQDYRKYTPAFIDDEDIQNSCLRFILTMGEKITAKKFQDYVHKNVLPHVTSSHTSILLETARKWLRCLGLVYQQHRQGIYYDGHECSDVVQHHTIFLDKMKIFESLMPQFVGENMEIIINPEISEENKSHIFVTHEECIFYANDSHPSVWAPLGMPPLHKKGKSKAIMVSEFLTETHGRLMITSEEMNELSLLSMFSQEARIIIKPEKNDDGCTNHGAFASDALCAKNMNLSPSGKQSRLCDGWFINEQDLPPDDPNYIFHDEPKGIRQVLREHNL
ncbi:10780_t:CDS:2, partial [Dentiscutata heterogama]